MGSSPLARGTLVAIWIGFLSVGLIPARAGNTNTNTKKDNIKPGSSPLARGTLPPCSPSLRKWGLIPARAGNTAEQQEPEPVPGAHPRSRGEHNFFR